MSDFWKRILQLRPGFVGTIVYFCPNQQNHLPCMVNADGTISPTSAEYKPFDERYNSASHLVDVIRSGLYEGKLGNFRMKGIASSIFYSFRNDFFTTPGRNDHERIKDLFDSIISRELAALDYGQTKLDSAVSEDKTNSNDGLRSGEIADFGKENNSETAAETGSTEVPVTMEWQSLFNDGPEQSTDDENEKDEAENQDDGFIMSEFWRVAIRVKPDLVGTTVYFAPTAKNHLACVVNHDGTFSPSCDRRKRYTEVFYLAMDMIKGNIDLGDNAFTLDKDPALYTCITDFFIDTDRQVTVMESLGKFEQCRGIARSTFKDLIKSQRWDTDQRRDSPIVVEKKIVRSTTCWQVAIGEKPRCDECEKSLQWLNILHRQMAKHPENLDQQRLKCSTNKSIR